MGLFSILATPIGLLLQGIYSLVGNYGIAIVILTIIIKAALYPVYAKSMKSTTRMSDLQPKVQEIQQKYANDRALMSEKLNELYKKENVSMYGGCLPMVVQMIVIMGLFTLLRNPMAYISSDNMLFAIHESFLWMQDLAQPDKWILPIGAGLVTFLSYNMSSASQAMSTGGAGQTKAMMNVMKYFFPIMILWMARSYPAGLAIYWFMSQVIQIGYNLRFASWKKKHQAEVRGKNNLSKRKRKRVVTQA